MSHVRVIADSRRLAWAYLVRVAQGPCASLVALVHEEGVEDAAAIVRAGVDRRLPVELRDAVRRIDCAGSDFAAMASCGARLVTPDDDEWAGARLSALSESDDVPPLALWVRGPVSLRAVTDRAVAVIGSRAPSEYGLMVAGEVSGDLAERKWTVVSGGSFGIDTAAHRAALAAGRVTVAVVPSGLDRAYPSANRELFDDIAQTGLIISEFPPEFVPDRSSFAAKCSADDVIVGGDAGCRGGFS